MIKAVFFDLDGVLVDSETMHQKGTEEFLIAKNYDIPKERFYKLIGSHKSLNPWKEILDGYIPADKQDDFVKELRAFKKADMDKLDFATIIFPEVEDSLKKLKEMGIYTACASSSNMEYIKRVLNSKDLMKYFDLIVTCDDFTKSKPDPEIYLYCNKKSTFDINECLVVEDSKLGIEAGKKVGMKVIARKDHVFGLDQREADYFVEDLTGLFDIIEQL